MIAFFAALTMSISAPPAKGEFLDQVRSHFAAWDADQDSKLSIEEVERAVDNPKVTGQAAAAAAALRRGLRSKGLTSITLDELQDATIKYDSMYDAALERITTANRAIFATETPKLDGLSQGRLGDCFLLASLGAIVQNDPARLKKTFTPLPDGKVSVRFAVGAPFTIDLPTDAEIALGSRNGNDGLWSLLYEKAIGTALLAKAKSSKHVTPFSFIGVGGTPHKPLELMTGHACRRVGCEGFQNGSIDAAHRDDKLAEVRKQLAATQSAGRLMVGGTAPLGGKQTVVPGLYYNHSYGVLKFDAATDEVMFWNPFGNRYTPKGSAGLKNGFVTEHGRFTMKLTEAVMWFGSFSIETDEPVNE